MITLLNDYFTIDSQTTEGDETIFNVTLLPQYCVYKGHFPGNPVSPGVCNIQMIKECAEQITGKKLFLGYISQCKFSVIITPQTTPHLQLRMNIVKTDDAYKIHTKVVNNITTHIDFKGEFNLMI